MSEVTQARVGAAMIHTAREVHYWFLLMMREHEEFEVETDRAWEPPLSFWSETVRRVVVE